MIIPLLLAIIVIGYTNHYLTIRKLKYDAKEQKYLLIANECARRFNEDVKP